MSRKKSLKKHTTLTESLGVHFELSERMIFTIGIIFFAIGVYLFLAFSSYLGTGEADQSIVTNLQDGEVVNAQHSYQNICGSLGAIISHFLIARCFGFAAYIIPLFIILVSLKLTRAYKSINLTKCFFALTLIMIWCSVAFAKFITPLMRGSVFNPGGDHGLYCVQYVENILGAPGLIAILAVGIVFLSKAVSTVSY